MLPFSAVDEAPVNITGHQISPKNQVQRIPSYFVNKTLEKVI